MSVHAQEPKPGPKPIVPDNWQGDALRPKPDMKGIETIRFITDSDYPPFHYYDEVGALTGFNVDLAQAICEVLEVECQIKATNWNDLIPTLDRGEADAAIASIRITAEALQPPTSPPAITRRPRALRRARTASLTTSGPRRLRVSRSAWPRIPATSLSQKVLS
ncbi:transporter substrate-binding domain-containing protein [Methyloceanibacter marginalis]|uniref:transporter substrate-binding domain-containing protein n=1 Tax=Methyloceanibacter marginalis TaxID=1774971 RepID=UPI00114CAE77|nr:transporter substrate-binding domain-containing protein [Methyloceanibacter marginalis]